MGIRVSGSGSSVPPLCPTAPSVLLNTDRSLLKSVARMLPSRSQEPLMLSGLALEGQMLVTVYLCNDEGKHRDWFVLGEPGPNHILK